MTLAQTRQLGIEVERRLQTALPQLRLDFKIDTEDIYAFLNQFQKQYIDTIYSQTDKVESGTRASVILEDILRTLNAHANLAEESTAGHFDDDYKVFRLPSDYYKYIRSVSKITGTYKNPNISAKVSNVLIKQPDANKVINQAYDKHRILRNPVVVLENGLTPAGTLKVIHDEYTTINEVDLTYIKLPGEFSILTDTPCELPYTCFEDLVAGATELYIAHLTATQPKQQPKKQENEQ